MGHKNTHALLSQWEKIKTMLAKNKQNKAVELCNQELPHKEINMKKSTMI